MARRVRAEAEPVESIDGVRLFAAGAMNLAMLALVGIGAPVAARLQGTGARNGFLISAGVLAVLALGVLAPVLWRGRARDRLLAWLASVFPGLILVIFVFWHAG